MQSISGDFCNEVQAVQMQSIAGDFCSIVLSKKGAMLRLHRSDGCSKAQTLSFASYEFCDLDPVPRSLYSHYCHSCWPRAPPQSGSASSSSSDDSSEVGGESSEE